MSDRTPAERFPPCEYLREELDEHGWSVETFCEMSGLRRDAVDEILSNKRRLTRLTALCIGNAFGQDAAVWLNLQAIYDGSET